ncbi:MAG: ABC transporter ATP-binding protein [Acidimicrobiales bacterium]
MERGDLATERSRRSAVEIEFVNASKRYPGQDVPAIRSLSLKVPAGEICCLVGPSGGGKTTAMKLVNRLIELTDGDVLIGGRSVQSVDPVDLRREIGYVIQEVGLFPHMTVAGNIAVVPRLLRWPAKRVAARVSELLALVRLDPAMSARYPAQLSGGQQQRVGLARALAVDPPVMLMDEPFGALDPVTRSEVQDELLRLQAQIHRTVIFVTHDIDEAIKMGDRIAVLREGGELAQYATADELLGHPADGYVAGFVGADRALKRLSLRRVGDLVGPAAGLPGSGPPHLATAAGAALGFPGAGARAAPAVSADTSLRVALSVLLDSGASELDVTGGDGTALGRLSLDRLREALAADPRVPAAEGARR